MLSGWQSNWLCCFLCEIVKEGKVSENCKRGVLIDLLFEKDQEFDPDVFISFSFLLMNPAQKPTWYQHMYDPFTCSDNSCKSAAARFRSYLL